jgi:hypothetical protein
MTTGFPSKHVGPHNDFSILCLELLMYLITHNVEVGCSASNFQNL